MVSFSQIASRQALSQIVEDIKAKLQKCQSRADHNKLIEERITDRFRNARAELQTKTDLVVSRVVEKSQEVSNTLTTEEQRRGGLVKLNLKKIHIREERLLHALQTAEKILDNQSMEKESKVHDIICTLKEVIEEEDPAILSPG